MSLKLIDMAHLALQRFDLGNDVIAYNVGKRKMSAWAYRIGKTLIDSGAPNMRQAFLPFILEDGDIDTIYVTHHHEDHSGGAEAIQAATGATITINQFSQALIRKGYRQDFYQHAVWGKFKPFQEDKCLDLPAYGSSSLKTGDGHFQVLHAPGHSHDMTVVYDAERKVLFSADLYLSTRQRLMRRDEHFAVALETLKRILELDVEMLLCGHRPVFENGSEKLAKKLVFMENAQSKILASLDSGVVTPKELDTIIGADDLGFRLLSLGNVSRANLVKSLLGDVKPRPDVVKAVGHKWANYNFD